jgi:hypothetical protein
VALSLACCCFDKLGMTTGSRPLAGALPFAVRTFLPAKAERQPADRTAKLIDLYGFTYGFTDLTDQTDTADKNPPKNAIRFRQKLPA